jgi:hypothetical protein
MGGGSYDGEVARGERSTNRDVFTYRGYAGAPSPTAQRSVHPDLNPYGKVRECMNLTPIVVAMDVTRSRGDDSRVIYAKLPMFIGQIELRGYVPGPAISFAAIGDATSGDRAPLQVGQFEADNRLDAVLAKIWLEEGGGGSGQESYELAAYYYARHTRLAAHERGEKGYFFFLGDEGFYPQVSGSQIRRILGHEPPTGIGAGERGEPFEYDQDVDAAQIFAELREKFHTFLIFPQKSLAERRRDIDAEIKQRVEAAGGRYEGVDIRASLLWNNRNDLDIHVLAPSGEHIFYGHKRSACGGWLDVDMNVRGETTKPVENVQWTRGGAPAGRYRVFLHNYRFHEPVGPTSYRVEIEINGEIQHFEGTIGDKGETGVASEITILEFDYDPSQRRPEDPGVLATGPYANYADEVILRQWQAVLPAQNILKIEDPRAIVDVMLGVMAIVGGGADLDTFIAETGQDQLDLRRDQAIHTLGPLAAATRMGQARVAGDLHAGDERPASRLPRL